MLTHKLVAPGIARRYGEEEGAGPDVVSGTQGAALTPGPSLQLAFFYLFFYI